MDFIFLISGQFIEEVIHSKTRQLHDTNYHVEKDETLFYYSYDDKKIICNFEKQFKNPFSSLPQLPLKKFSTPNFVILSDFIEAGGDENLIINFLWPGSPEYRNVPKFSDRQV